MTVSEMIEHILQARGWAVKSLAYTLGCSEVSVYKWRSGKTQPRVAARERIEELYDESGGAPAKTPAPAAPNGESLPPYMNEIREALRIARQEGGDQWHILIQPTDDPDELRVDVGIRRDRSA